MRCEASDKQQQSLNEDAVPFRVAMARRRGRNWRRCQAEAKSSQREADEILYVSLSLSLELDVSKGGDVD